MNNWSALPSISLSSGFEQVNLSKIISHSRNSITIKDDVSYTRVTIRQYGQGVFTRDTLMGKDIGTKKQFIANAGQLIVSGIDVRNGSVGIIPRELNDAVVTNDFWLFDISNKAIPQYLTLLLSSKTFRGYWQSKSSDTTNRQRVNKSEFLKMEIPLPSIDIQRKFIKQYNKDIEKSNHLEKKSTEMLEKIQAYVSDILGRKKIQTIEEKPFRMVKFSLLQDWSATSPLLSTIESTKFEVTNIGAICDVNSGGTPSRNNKHYFMGTIPWVKTGEVQDSIIVNTEEKISEEALKNSSAKLYPAESIIIAMYGHTRGKTAKLNISATTNQACAVLHNINKSKVLTDYLWLYMQTEYSRLRKLAVGSAQPNLNAGMIKNYPIILPSIEMQAEIVKNYFSMKDKAKAFEDEAILLRKNAKIQFENSIVETH